MSNTDRSSGYEPLVGSQPEEQGFTPTEEEKKAFGTPEPAVPEAIPTQPTAPVPYTPGTSPRYKRLVGLATGVLQIFAGVLMLLIDTIELIINGIYHPAYWVPSLIAVIYIVAGILGVVSRNQRQCVIIAYMVMSIIAAVCVTPQGIGSVAAAITVVNNCYYWDCSDRYIRVTMTSNAIIAVLALIELVVAIVASAFCCHGACACDGAPTETAVVMYDPANPGHQVVLAQAPGPYPPQNSYPQEQAPGPYPPQSLQSSYSQGQAVNQHPGAHNSMMI